MGIETEPRFLLGGRRRNGVHEEIAGVGPIDLGNVEGAQGARCASRHSGQCSSLGSERLARSRSFPIPAADCAAPGAPQLAQAIQIYPAAWPEWQDQLNPQGYGVRRGTAARHLPTAGARRRAEAWNASSWS